MIRVSVSPGEMRIAGLRGDVLTLAAIERPGQRDGVGDLHWARIAGISTAMSGAFVTLAGGATGFLPESELPPPRRPIAQSVQEGQAIGLRVTRAAQGGKGPRVTARLDAAEQALLAAHPQPVPALLRQGDGAALRFAALWPEAPVIVDAAPQAALLRQRLGADRVRLQMEGAFDAELDAAFDDLTAPQVDLGAGARLLIHPTPALVAIDVDAGSLAGSRDATAHLAVNTRAAQAIAREILLRNLAGAILVDFAGLTAKRREALLEPMQAALRADPLQPRLLGLTRLGLMEIVRPRIHPPLHEVLGLPASALTRGLAALRRAARDAAAAPGRAFALQAAPDVIAALQVAPGALEDYRIMTGRALSLRPDPALRPGGEQVMEVTA